MIKKENIIDIYLLFVILFSGLSLSLYRSNIGLIVLFIVGLLFFFKKSFNPPQILLKGIAIWLGYFLINTLIINSFHQFFILTYIIYLFIAWWLISYYKIGFFEKFENIIYKLTIISLCFYTWQIISSSSLHTLMTSLDLSGKNASSKSIIIYTYHYLSNSGELPRNAGFTWEPGPFASYIALALFINIIRQKNSFRDKKRIFVFILAIITTQSTTGFILLLAILLWYAWAHYQNKAFRIFSIPISILIVVLLFTNVPWLQQKILTESQQNIEEVISHAEETGKTYNPGRFASMQLRFEDYKKFPIAGYGGNIKLQTGYIDEDNVVSAVNGLGNILGRYGTIGAVLFLFMLFKTGKLLASIFNYQGWIIFPVLIFIIGFSFGIIESPIIITFWLIPLFLSNRNKQQNYNL